MAITDCNLLFCAMLKTSKSKISKMNFLEFIPPDLNLFYYKKIFKKMKLKISQQVLIPVVLKGDNLIILSVIMKVIFQIKKNLENFGQWNFRNILNADFKTENSPPFHGGPCELKTGNCCKQLSFHRGTLSKEIKKIKAEKFSHYFSTINNSKKINILKLKKK